MNKKQFKPKLSYPTEETKENKPFFHGHRARERERLMKTPFGQAARRDLLEVLLYFCNPRSDTKPIATDILNYTNGEIRRILFFDENDIKNIRGINETFLCMVRCIREFILNNHADDINDHGTQFNDWTTVHKYLQTHMSHSKVECFRMLVLNNSNQLIKDCLVSQGTVDHTSVYTRDIVKIVVDTFATSVILAHNHPSGDVTPSQSDIDTTKSIINALNTVSVRVQDHIIIGKGKVFSFLEAGLL